MTHDQSEREALLDLWEEWPETRPDGLTVMRPYIQRANLRGQFEEVPPLWVAALSRDRLTNLLIGKGIRHFEWYVEREYTALYLGGDCNEDHARPTPLLALISAYRAMKATQ